MSEQKKTGVDVAENILNATISEEGFAKAKEAVESLSEDNGNKEAIIKVIEALKGQDNLTLCRTIETLFFLVPAQMVIAVMEALKYHLKVRTLSILKESLSELLKGKEEKKKEDE